MKESYLVLLKLYTLCLVFYYKSLHWFSTHGIMEKIAQQLQIGEKSSENPKSLKCCVL